MDHTLLKAVAKFAYTLGLYIKPDTKVYGIIGKPCWAQQLSPLLFNAAFKKVDILNAIYVPLLVDDVEKFFHSYSSLDAGLHVVIDFPVNF